MKAIATTAFLGLCCGIALASTNQVITLDAEHNNVGADRRAATYSLAACESFIIDASKFEFTKPVEKLLVGVYTGQVFRAHFVTNIASTTTMRFSVDAKHLVASNDLTSVTFSSGSRILIAFLYKRPDDPFGVMQRYAPSEWLGYAEVE